MATSTLQKGSSEVVYGRRLTQLCSELWNLTRRWEELNEEACVCLKALSNNRIKLRECAGNEDKAMLIEEEIVRASDHLCSTFLPLFSEIVDKFAKGNETLLPLLCAIDNLASVKSDDVSLSSVTTLRRRVHQLSEIVPPLLVMFQEELRFKKDTIDDLAFCDDADKSVIHLYNAILSSWQHNVYVDSALLNCLYALVV